MKKLLIAFLLLISFTSISAQKIDSDGDGLTDSEDLCPFVKGSKEDKGCPAEAPKNKSPKMSSEETKSAVFITQPVFEDILETICENSMHLKVGKKLKIEDRRTYVTTFSKNGLAKNLPVYYMRNDKNSFTTTIGLATDTGQFHNAAVYINQLMKTSTACWKAYRVLNVVYDTKTRKYADVHAWETNGLFFFLEKELHNGKKIVQLRITRVNYGKEEKKPIVNPIHLPVGNICTDMETILKACINGFGETKGTFVKKETPAEYYTTTLPSLGFKEKNVVESVNIEFENGNMIRKKIIYYSGDQNFSNNDDALRYYEQIKNQIKKCYSGTVNLSDEKNQKIYELFTDYKGKNIRIALIYLNFFQSSVSITFRINE